MFLLPFLLQLIGPRNARHFFVSTQTTKPKHSEKQSHKSPQIQSREWRGPMHEVGNPSKQRPGNKLTGQTRPTYPTDERTPTGNERTDIRGLRFIHFNLRCHLLD